MLENVRGGGVCRFNDTLSYETAVGWSRAVVILWREAPEDLLSGWRGKQQILRPLTRPEDDSLRLLYLHQPLTRQPSSGWCRSQASASRFAIPHVHIATDFTHRIDHLVGRNGERDSRHRHLDRGEGDRRTGRVAKDTGELDETTKRIAHEAECTLLRDRYRMRNL